MNRRSFLHQSALASAVLAALPLAGCAPETAKTPATAATDGNAAATPADFPLHEATLTQLADYQRTGRYTARQLCELYLQRIEALDQHGPQLRAVLARNPEALVLADALDQERRAGKLRGPLHGIPVLIKDNIDTADQQPTTAGALALAGHKAKRDAFVVTQLRAAGAIILGKTNLSEWANFRSTRSTSGWSAVGGQTRNPYVLDRSPSGSSSGSGAAVAASLCAVAVGTETDGSVVSPASCNGLVGLKPTVGLLSRAGIIPISSTQDTAGPMARTVRDAALLLAALVGQNPADPADPATRTSTAHRADYASLLTPNALRGQRLGVEKTHLSGTSGAVLLQAALDVLRQQGATIVEVEILKATAPLSEPEFQVLLYEFKDGLNRYLAAAAAPTGVRSLAEVIAFNQSHAAESMPFFQQEILEMAQKTTGLAAPAYLKALARTQAGARAALDNALQANHLTAIVGITTGPAWCIDLANGDYSTGVDFSSPAAMAGYPHLTVPMGQVLGLPVGLSFVGTAWNEAQLLALGYAYEQASQLRRAPGFQGVVGG